MIDRTDLDRLSRSLRTIESIALLNRVASTNELGRRIIDECVENEIELPLGIIVAREQSAGRGRSTRSWHSPAGGGIYASMVMATSRESLQYLPIHAAVIVASYLREVFSIDAAIKWPNDIQVDGKKIAGILIEARTAGDLAYVCIGVGINVHAVGPAVPEATSIAETASLEAVDLEAALIAFIEYADAALSEAPQPAEMLEMWKRLTVHRPGDRIASVVGQSRVEGTWQGLDELGRAIIRQGSSVLHVSAGELIVLEEN